MIALWLWALMQLPAGQPSVDLCDLPKGLETAIGATYPGTKVINLSDLGEDDRKYFLEEHEGNCPGLIPVDFYGDGQPTFALALATPTKFGFDTKLVVAHRVGAIWKTVLLDKTGGPAPVIWSEKAGEYEGVYGAKMRSNRPVILFVGYESWAVMYAWGGRKVKHIQIRD
jgi:hypothetical protein